MKLIDYLEIILEGGGLGSNFNAVKIAREDIKPTIEKFNNRMKQVTGIDIFKGETFGSVGKKDFSGDIDIALDIKTSKTFFDWIFQQGKKNKKFDTFIERTKLKKDGDEAILSATLNFAKSTSSPFPNDIKCIGYNFDFLQGNLPSMINFVFDQIDHETLKSNGKKVQIDLEFGDVNWIQFLYTSEIENDRENKEVKTLHKSQIIKVLINLISKENIKLPQQGFLKNKKFSTDMKEFISEMSQLLNVKVNESDLKNYSSLTSLLKKAKDKKIVKQIFDGLSKTFEEKYYQKKKDILYFPKAEDFGL